MEKIPQPMEFERKKTSYFSRFAALHLGDMRILRKGGILGKENQDWRNVSEHCLTEAVGADVLAEHLGADRKKLVTAAILHDWYKRREVEAMKKLGGGVGHHATAHEDEKLLREYGVPDDIIHLAHANIPESLDPAYVASRTLEEKIMHYLDLITSGSTFVKTFAERLEPIMKKPHNIEFSESYRPRYNGKSLFEVQQTFLDEEQKEFEEKLGIPEGTLPDFILKKIEERINAHQ